MSQFAVPTYCQRPLKFGLPSGILGMRVPCATPGRAVNENTANAAISSATLVSRIRLNVASGYSVRQLQCNPCDSRWDDLQRPQVRRAGVPGDALLGVAVEQVEDVEHA